MAMVTRICTQCRKEYRTHHTTRLKYCTQACSASATKRGEEVACVQCGKGFYRHLSRADRRYCSIGCGITARNLTEANPSYGRDISGEKNPMFGKGMSGPENPMFGKRKEAGSRWAGGRRVRKDGYIVVVAPGDHPHPCETKASGLKYILEHRLAMEAKLGRYLEPGEVVHHKDEDPSNNSPENLELFASQSEHISVGHGRSGS